MANIKNEKKKEIMDKVLSGIKLQDAGKKWEKYKSSCSPCDEIMYPSFYLDIKQAPDLKGYDVKDKVAMIIEGVITGHDANESETSKHESFNVKIKKIGIKPKTEDK